MTALKNVVKIMAASTDIKVAPLKRGIRVIRQFNKFKFHAAVLAILMSFTGFAAQAQSDGIVNCVIASNDGENGFRTDEITGCRINPTTGDATFGFKEKDRTRTYDSVEPLTTQHLEAATFWLNRVGQLRFPARTNPAGFDPQEFLRAASQATQSLRLG